MRYFPVFFDLQGQDVLVVGGGNVAERKIRLLLQAGARVHVVAHELNGNIRHLAKSQPVRRVARDYDPMQLSGKRLVFAATDDATLNRRVYDEAEAAGVPVNVVDDREHCRFISPAVVDRSPVQVAISTGGTAPVLARRLRNWIERLLPQGLGKVAEAAGAMRQNVAARIAPEGRRRFWEGLLNDEQMQRWSAQAPGTILADMQNKLVSRAAGHGQGMVYLVGAGPGNPDLLTIRALQVLGAADVVLHDRLVSDDVLDLARRDADRIYVGKEAGNHHRQQEEIHRIMLEQTALGRTVVRLKGGDAFIFGRGGEELDVLRAAGVRYEVVPGITAAIGCAAYAGIPLTHREHSQSVSFVTGHLASGKPPSARSTAWERIAGEGRTAVVYMGVKQASAIREQLLQAGINRGLPVALVENGSRGSQRVLQGTVDSIPALAGQSRNGQPGLLIIGQVAALSGKLGWFDYTPSVKNAA